MGYNPAQRCNLICDNTLERFGLPAWRRLIANRVSQFASEGDGATLAHRVGLGEDRHRLTDGGPLRLGGIDVPHDKQAVGHSDADVLLHAVTDALLGAAALGDIGQMFPDSDGANRNRDSAEMLRLAYERVAADGWRIANLDVVVHAQRPKLAPHHAAMRARMAELLGTDQDQISIKAKTGESIGLVGREEVIEARCVAMLVREEGVGK
jgi:2-C-methyl-D-erythritol 2,4-cyclodiphosphate synthase